MALTRTPSFGRYIPLCRRLLLGATCFCDDSALHYSASTPRYIIQRRRPLHFSASLDFSAGPFYRDVPKITRNSASVLKKVRVLTPPRLLSQVFQNLELLELSFTPLTFDLADLESSRNGWIMNVVADSSPSKGLDFASAKVRERKSRPYYHSSCRRKGSGRGRKQGMNNLLLELHTTL